MEVASSSALQFPHWMGCERNRGKQNSVIEFNKSRKIGSIILANHFGNLRGKRASLQRQNSYLSVSNASKDLLIPELQSRYASLDRNWLLKKGQEVRTCLKDRCIFLVGMMGSGKTTVGKILSESLGYASVDSDEYVEQLVNGISVAQIFQQYGEIFFRNIESKALKELSLMPRQVIATGGGAVVCPMNWKYMKGGITIFLDVPVDALARRIAAVGTDSRPLLNFDSEDPYTKTFMGLSTLWRKRGEAYSGADVTISIMDLAKNLSLDDVSDLPPAAIALEVLIQIQNYLKADDCNSMPTFSS